MPEPVTIVPSEAAKAMPGNLPPKPGEEQKPPSSLAPTMPVRPEAKEAVPISLAQVFSIVATGAIPIGLARQEIHAAYADEKKVRDSQLPAISVGTRWTKVKGEVQTDEGQNVDVDRQNVFVGGGPQLVFDPGTAIFTLRVAHEETVSRVEDFRSASNDALHDAAHQYFDLMEAHAQVAVLEDARERAVKLVNRERERVALGQQRLADVLSARARLAEREDDLIKARNDADPAKLVATLGFAPATVLVPEETELRPVEMVAIRDLDPLLKLVYSRRPEVASAEAKLEGARQDEKLKKYRVLIPVVQSTTEDGGLGEDYGKLDYTQQYTAGLFFTIGPTLRDDLDHSRAERRKAEIGLDGVRRNVAQEVVTAFRSAQASADRLSFLTIDTRASRQAYDLEWDRYDTGKALQVELTSADDRLTSAEKTFATAIADYDRTQYDLFRAVGGLGRIETKP